MSLQRMIVMPPDTFERWKKIIVEDKKLSDLDREMKKVLYNNKINVVSKWHHYRQNLLKYLNTKQKRNHTVDKTKNTDATTQTNSKKYNHKEIQTFTPDNRNIGVQAARDNSERNHLIHATTHNHKKTQTSPPDNRSIGTQARIMKKLAKIPPIEEVFATSSRFSSLEDESDNINDGELVELDVDDLVRQKALEGQPSSVKIAKERQSFDPNEYRLFELNTGDTVNVPIEKQMITRATLKRSANPDSTQTTLDFPNQKKKVKQVNTSTPKKPPPKKEGIAWKAYK